MNFKYSEIPKLEEITSENRLFNNLLRDYNYNLKQAERLKIELNQKLKILRTIEYEYNTNLTEEELNEIEEREKSERKEYRQIHDQLQNCFKLNLRQTKQLSELIELTTGNQLTTKTTEDEGI